MGKESKENIIMKKWEAIFTEADREVLKAFGRKEKQSFGKKPALIIVDVVRSFIGSKPKSPLEASGEYRTSCGEAGGEALKQIKKLLDAFRAKSQLLFIHPLGSNSP